MVKTSDFESENSSSSLGEAARDELFNRIALAISGVASAAHGCGGERCCCHGVAAFECQTGLDVDEIALAVLEALDNPSQITPDRAGS